MAPSKLRFSDYEMDASRFELRRAGHRIRLERKPLELLMFLAGKPGQLVGREEIIEQVWGKGVFFDAEHGVNNAIRKIRAALNDDPDHPKYLETVVGKGYRFIGEIDVAGTAPATPRTLGMPAKAIPEIASPYRTWAPLIAAALVLLISMSIWGWMRAGRRSASPALPGVHSIAVLPLANLSGDPTQDYLAQGMTDELITELAKIGSLRVISRTSSTRYSGNTKPLPEIAKELRVDAVVEGALVRSGDKLRVTVQLIEANTDKHLWAESYERDVRNVLTLQYEIARDTAEHINGTLASTGPVVPVHRRTVSPEAYEAYLRGRFFWNKWTEDGVRKSIQYYLQAIKKDPDYALAYAGLADSYVSLGDFGMGVLTPREASRAAEDAALKAIALEDTLAEAHAALAMARFRYGNLREDEREFKRAIQLNPGSVTAHHWYSHYLLAAGRDQEALAEGERAYDLSPIDPEISVHLQFLFWDLHNYDRAVSQGNKGLELDPDFSETHQLLGQAYEAQGKYKEATVELRKAVELSGHRVMVLSALGHVLAVSGDRRGAWRILSEFERDSHHRFIPAFDSATILAGLGEKDRAIAQLEKAYQENSTWLFNLNRDPRFDPLRSDPRFQDLARRIQIPQ